MKVTKRRNEKSSSSINEKQEPLKKDLKSDDSVGKKEAKEFKYGPLPRFSGQRVWSRGIVVVGVVIYILYFSSKNSKEIILAKQSETYYTRSEIVECSPEYLEDTKRYKGCTPKKCGRHVSDSIVTPEEADILLKLAVRVMSLGGSSGGASIMDLHTGALSYNDRFINLYAQNPDKILTPDERTVYQLVRKKIQNSIAESFGIDFDSLHLTYPTFFSRLTNVEPVTRHDEYWHEHIDKRTYESFHYTSLLYLNDYGQDFQGGRFIFLDDINKPTRNVTIEPKKGRVSMFTSGHENPHYVERVKEGLRFAATISFTCDSTKAIQDPIS